MVRTAGAQRHRVFFLCVSAPLWFFSSSAFATTVWDGVYTAAQAERGRTAYTQYCVRCHKPDLMGIEDAMKGDAFMERRREDTLEPLFLDMKATMPRGNPGGLPDQTYVDIITFILKNNDMPEGTSEMKPDLLDRIDVVRKDGPQPVPNFALVLSVGCLTQSNDRWLLINASEPVRTRDSFKRIDKELNASEARPLGPHIFRLADAEDFGAVSKVGKKVQVKGVIVRAPAGNRINVNSIETVAETCP